MKKALQGFGIGLFVAGAILTLLTQFADYQQSNDNDEVKQLQNQLRAAEQEIATLNEAVAQTSLQTEQQPPAETAVDEADSDKEQPANNNETPKEEAEKKPASKDAATTGTIIIYEGVSLYDIGKQAEDQGIVQNGRELELYLAKPEYSRSIQKGVFELRSDMTLEKMAKILTGKK